MDAVETSSPREGEYKAKIQRVIENENSEVSVEARSH